MGVVFVWMHGERSDLIECLGQGTLRLDRRKASPGSALRTQAELGSFFSELGIDCRQIEFYNQPAFKAAEQNNPTLLERYAEFVEASRHDVQYLARARQLVPKIAAYLRAELGKSGQEGACVDSSLALSKLLERVGIWNYVAAGSLTVECDPETQLPAQHWPHMLGNSEAVGHAWLTAPPFRVIDLALAQQTSAERIQPHLPEMIVAEECEEVAEVSLDDMIHADLQLKILLECGTLPTIHDVMARKPEILRIMRTFRPFAVRSQRIVAKYFPCCITALEEPFEAVRLDCFSRRSLPELLDGMRRDPELRTLLASFEA